MTFICGHRGGASPLGTAVPAAAGVSGVSALLQCAEPDTEPDAAGRVTWRLRVHLKEDPASAANSAGGVTPPLLPYP